MWHKGPEISLCVLLLATACKAQDNPGANQTTTAPSAQGTDKVQAAPMIGNAENPPVSSTSSSPVLGIAPEPTDATIWPRTIAAADGETYQPIAENPVRVVSEAPVSTFSIDVDTAAYANARRFLMRGQMPPKDAIRVEEMINYFHYDYPAPASRDVPFLPTTRVIRTPWNPNSYLLEIGIKGYQHARRERPPANLVFLIDVSGSMSDADKLPLLKAGMKLLAQQLTARDRVSIVVYAGASGIALEPMPGDDTAAINAALDRLEAGGGTAGAEGIQAAYRLAQQARIKGGINRIILATDGDFNIGITDPGQLKALIEENRQHGIALSTLGFGGGNYNDAVMEQLADTGNGNYGYVDTLKEAKRLLVDQLDGTIETIAKDVKVQIEFNPAVITSYRQIGYQDRVLSRADFNNDRKDAGEIGVGHAVTALYEITPVGAPENAIDPLRYGAPPATPAGGAPGRHGNEFAFLRLRYKDPASDKSKLLEMPLMSTALRQAGAASSTQDFAAAVAAYGLKLRQEDAIAGFSWDEIAALAEQTRGPDEDGTRHEFLDLVALAKGLKS